MKGFDNFLILNKQQISQCNIYLASSDVPLRHILVGCLCFQVVWNIHQQEAGEIQEFTPPHADVWTLYTYVYMYAFHDIEMMFIFIFIFIIFMIYS